MSLSTVDYADFQRPDADASRSSAPGRPPAQQSPPRAARSKTKTRAKPGLESACISAPNLSTAESRETSKALRVARDLRDSATISNQQNMTREMLKVQLESEKERKYVDQLLLKKERQVAWGRKLSASPFLVDQQAECERIDEEHKVKLAEEARRCKAFEKRKDSIKTEIILRALAEANDLESLREEKRLIAEEERKLKSRMEMEKRNRALKREEQLSAMKESARRRNEQASMKQKQRLALIEAETRRRQQQLLMKMEVKYGEVDGEK